MSITIKTPEEIEKMRVAGRLASEVLDYIAPYVVAGVTTEQLDKLRHDYMVDVQQCIPAPLNYAPSGYNPYPQSICTSVNQQVCHGVPGDRVLKNGDIINLDITTIKDEYHGDTSRMFIVGEGSIQAKRLCEITFECMWLGISVVKPGAYLGDIGAVIQKHAEKNGYSVVREFCGHGIGKKFHEDPPVLHYGKAGTGPSVEPGMMFTIEPIQCRQGGDPRNGRRLDHRYQGSQPFRAMGAHAAGHRNIAGGTSTQLNGELDGAAGVKPDFVISPDSNTAVYRSDEGAETLLELYSVPLTGGIPTKLNPTPLAGGDVLEQAISPYGARVVHRADQELDSVNELYSVPIGGGIPTKLNGVLPTNGDVLDFAISPDSGRVVYRADQTTNDLNELWSVPLAGGANTRLNRTLTSAGDVQTFLISPNSQWVVYGADQDVDAVERLLRVPIGGGTVEGVSSAPVPGGDIVLTFLTVPVSTISPTNSYDVLYAADEDLNDDVELYLSGAPEEEPADACVPDGLTLCLQNDKFDIRVTG